ncbi:MAG TPA: GFA family protein [Afipia sp.]
MTQTGGCLCGGIRYEIHAEPLLSAVCHCRHCQRQSGAAFSVVSAFPASAYMQTGVTRIFADKGDSGKSVARHFCPDCGSPIASVAEAIPDVVLIKAASLDAFADILPTAEVYCDNALPWLPALTSTRFPRSNI